MIIFMGLISLVVIGILLWPLLRSKAHAPEISPLDAAIDEYRTRLADLDRDIAKGGIAREDAEEARAEIGRHLLRERRHLEGAQAGDPFADESRPGKARGLKMAAIILIVLIPMGAGILYWRMGNPGYEDHPFAGRSQRADQATINGIANADGTNTDRAGQNVSETSNEAISEQLTDEQRRARLLSFIADLETRLKDTPADSQGWVLLARSYEALGRVEKAEGAWRGLLNVDPDNADALWFLGVYAARAKNTQEAKLFWTRLLSQYDPSSDEFSLVTKALATLSSTENDVPLEE